MAKPNAVIIGVGDGLSAALARNLMADYSLTLAARSADTIQSLADKTGARMVLLDATEESAVAALFDDRPEAPRVAICNPSARVRGPITDLSVEGVRRAIDVTAIGVFLTGKHAAKRMLEAEAIDGKKGTILFTGASAGVKGFPQSAPFAMASSPSAAWPKAWHANCTPKGSMSLGSTSTVAY